MTVSEKPTGRNVDNTTNIKTLRRYFMNDERYILARVKAQLIQMLNDKDAGEYDRKDHVIHMILDLITAVEVTAVLDMDVDDLLGRKGEDA